MERHSKPYFPRRMKKREKQRIAGLAGSSENVRPGTSQSAVSGVSGVSGVSAVSGITGGSSASSGPRKEVPEGLKKRLKRPEEVVIIASLESGTEGGAGTHRPQLRRGAMYTQQWVRGNAVISSPIAPQINSPISAPTSSGPAVVLGEKGLNIIREESATPVWLAEERSRLLIERGKCLLLLRAVRKMDDLDIAGNTDPAIGVAQKKLEIVEEKLRAIQDKIATSRGNTGS